MRCIPNNEFSSTLAFCHVYVCGGHFGPKMTTRKILDSSFYWPTLFHDAYVYCKSCEKCQRAGNISRRYEMPQQPIFLCDIFDVWGVDFVGPFTVSFGFIYMLWIMFLNGWRRKPHEPMILVL